jgi:hypothetical protein
VVVFGFGSGAVGVWLMSCACDWFSAILDSLTSFKSVEI